MAGSQGFSNNLHMSRDDAIGVLSSFSSGIRVSDVYDDDIELREALSVLIPDFEYPDFCGREIRSILNSSRFHIH